MKQAIGTAMSLFGLVLVCASVRSEEARNMNTVRKVAFGTTEEGRKADLYILTNKNGVEVSVTNFGATVVGIKAPNRSGKISDITLGYDSLGEYVASPSYFGATIGRYGNRIAHGEFVLKGVKYTLARNNGENHLHGGSKGFNKVFWTVEKLSSTVPPSIRFVYLSKDGEEGYPGNLTAQVTFTLTDKNELKIDYLATTDKETVVNLTNHTYFNLGDADTILDHQLMLNASRYTPVDAGLIPTGELRNVQGTPFDFRKFIVIGERINQDDEQLKSGKGYDHNWVIDASEKKGPALAATAYEPKSGRGFEVWTTEPGIQFYSGNFLDGSIHGKGGKAYAQRSAFCLETQHFPDSPNHPNFPSTVLTPGAKYRSETIYKFFTK
jgi:aldose 1-epimerase